ncbi:MAG: cob(I)yrinic acid a,c-diamide adenosyltransferase [Phycisphaerales bacterium]|nr:cob(I)yrinic acid a,c-diamide adenosyltransferase [Phycisphaerales bacterium]
MPLYTKTGDDGSTGLFGGGRILKNDVRMHAVGDVDETNAAIGSVHDESLNPLQSLLFDVGADLATPVDNEHVRRIDEEDIASLEAWIDKADSQNDKLNAFVLPGGSTRAASLHLARAVCRRAERSIVSLHRQGGCSLHILILINRLSDLLFALARLANKEEGIQDTPWIARSKETKESS